MNGLHQILARVRALEAQIVSAIADQALAEDLKSPEQVARQADRRREDALRISNIERDTNRRVAAIRKKSLER